MSLYNSNHDQATAVVMSLRGNRYGQSHGWHVRQNVGLAIILFMEISIVTSIKNIAVYGTLRYGGSANYHMEGCKYLGQDTVRGKLYNLGAFPAALLIDNSSSEDDDCDKIVVDIYALPENEFERDLKLGNLDRYEGYFPEENGASLFIRREILTHEGALPVYFYEYSSKNVNNGLLISSGDWLHEA